MTSSSGIKIISPVTLSFDSFGMNNLSLALECPANELIVKSDTKNRDILFEDTSLKKLENPDLLISIGNKFAEEFGIQFGAIVSVNNKIPVSTGLGNLEANISALIFALNELNKLHLDKNKIFNFIEKYGKDNDSQFNLSSIAANIFGGFIAYDKNILSSVQKIYEPRGLVFSIFSFSSAIANDMSISACYSSDIITFVKAMMTSDVSLLKDFFQNNSFQNQFLKSSSLFSEIRNLSIKNDALGAAFTRNKSSIFIIYENTVSRDNNDIDIALLLKSMKLYHKYFSSSISQNGIFKS